MKKFPDYKAEPTSRTPGLDLKEGVIFIGGRSIMENPGEFYRPVYEWICDYVRNNEEETMIEFGFEYINTSSTKWIYNIIKEISGIHDLTETRVFWYYEQGDDDMCELGMILKSLVGCQFTVEEVEKIKKSPLFTV